MPVENRTCCLAGIFDDGDSTTICHVHHRLHRHPAAVQMRNDDRFCFVRDGRFELRHIELPARRINVNQNWRCTDCEHVLKVGFEIVGREDDLVARANSNTSKCEFDCRSSTRTQNRFGNAVKRGELLGQCFTVWAMIFAPRAIFQARVQSFRHFRPAARPRGRTF